MSEYYDPDYARSTRVLSGISSKAWEHPADRAALEAVRRIPVFDKVVRVIFGFFGEAAVRLAFQANAVRVGPNQFPKIFERYREVCRILDAPWEYPLFVTQDPAANAGAYGMSKPFIIVNSGTVELLDDRQLAYILGHEVGHVMSGHVLYTTMTRLLLALANLGFPIVGIAARVILLALLEWSRKAELSADRAGLLAVQDADLVCHSMLKMASGVRDTDQTSVSEFVKQAEQYRTSGDVLDQVFKVINLIGQTHPFWTLRLSELRAWIESGGYDNVVQGVYPRRGEADEAYVEDLRAAADAYKQDAADTMGAFTDAAKRAGESIWSGLTGR